MDDYYSFGELSGEFVRLCPGVSEDEDGEYPTEHDFPDLYLILFVDGLPEDSEILFALKSRPDRFKLLREDRYEED